jgi:hypothetical protein
MNVYYRDALKTATLSVTNLRDGEGIIERERTAPDIRE